MSPENKSLNLSSKYYPAVAMTYTAGEWDYFKQNVSFENSEYKEIFNIQKIYPQYLLAINENTQKWEPLNAEDLIGGYRTEFTSENSYVISRPFDSNLLIKFCPNNEDDYFNIQLNEDVFIVRYKNQAINWEKFGLEDVEVLNNEGDNFYQLAGTYVYNIKLERYDEVLGCFFIRLVIETREAIIDVKPTSTNGKYANTEGTYIFNGLNEKHIDYLNVNGLTELKYGEFIIPTLESGEVLITNKTGWYFLHKTRFFRLLTIGNLEYKYIPFYVETSEDDPYRIDISSWVRPFEVLDGYSSGYINPEIILL